MYPNPNSNNDGNNVPLLAKPQPPVYQPQQPVYYNNQGPVTTNGYIQIAEPQQIQQQQQQQPLPPPQYQQPVVINSKLGNWMNSTTPRKRNCFRFCSCLLILGGIATIITLSLLLACQSSTWNATSNFEINMSTDPVSTLIINVDVGDVFFGVSPSPSADGDEQIIRIENRIYSQKTGDASDYKSEFVLDTASSIAVLDMNKYKEDNQKLGCVRPEINVIFPYGSSMNQFNVELNGDFDNEVRFSSYPSVMFGSIKIKTKTGRSPVFLDNLSANTIHIDVENRAVKSTSTSAISTTIRTENEKIVMKGHTILNNNSDAVFDVKTSNAKVVVDAVVLESKGAYTGTTTIIKASSDNDKVQFSHMPEFPFTGTFIIKTSNAKARIDSDTTDVSFSKNSKDEKVGMYPGPQQDWNSITLESNNANVRYRN